MNQFSISGYVTGEFPKLIAKWNDAGRKQITWESVLCEEGLADHGITHDLVRLCWSNHRVWHHEDPCRSGVPELIISNKPQIDVHNQIRNDTIEKVDQWVVGTLQTSASSGPAPIFNTETIGSVSDRLSILALKLYHTRKLADEGVEKARKRVPLLESQWRWLATEFAKLVFDVQRGKRMISVFCQHKLYNDPLLNRDHVAARLPVVNPPAAPDTCPECGCPGGRPALEHFKGCRLRVEFFGGDKSWDKDRTQVRDGTRYFWNEVMGTWRLVLE